jgi:GTPase SAR1 family protein
MLEFISLLLKRYQIIQKANVLNGSHYAYQQTLEQLTLTQAFFTKGLHKDNLPLQIAVVGPTQAGKSSIVNVLLQSTSAGVSPLAGYTVHPQGFCYDICDKACEQYLAEYFFPFMCSVPNQLNKSNYACYSLSSTDTVTPYLPPSVLWDTPDFDSIDSTVYREGVLKTIALADMVILIVSKEKYADQSVWDMMKCIEPLRQPTLICVNKLNEGAESVVLESLQEKWRDTRRDAFPQVLPLFYQKNTQIPEIAQSKKHVLFELAKKVQREKQAHREQKLLQTYWQSWTAPLREEHVIYDAWQQLVNQVVEQSLRNYARDYLNHPRHYETFQQAIAELLLLLEIPSVARVMVTARKALLYPLKKLRSIGRSRANLSESSHEMTMIKQLIDHTLTELAHQLIDKNTHPLWRDISLQLRDHHAGEAKLSFHNAQAYHHLFQQDVQLAAQGLYHKLEEQPLVLNTLRATRVSADAAVLALTLYAGGIGLHDLVIAPAMLTLTNLLTESAIGSYMRKVESDLKVRQLAAVKAQIFDPMSQRLRDLPQLINSDTHFAISPKQLLDAEAQLDGGKPHGLRLL